MRNGRSGAHAVCAYPEITWLEVYQDETLYTYSPRFKRAARATRGADVHAECFPWACGVNGAPWSTPGAARNATARHGTQRTKRRA